MVKGEVEGESSGPRGRREGGHMTSYVPNGPSADNSGPLWPQRGKRNPG